MCFNVTSKVKKATKDIVCWKSVEHGGKPIWGYLYISGQQEKYKKGYHYTEALFPKDKKRYNTITTPAFHSFKKELYAMMERYGNYIMECIIPKGSYYYENENEYCSSDLIVVNLIKKR